MNKIQIPLIEAITSNNWQDYCLLDSGNGQTLERFGPYLLIRPEPQAIWKKSLPKSSWDEAHARMQETNTEYGGQWHVIKSIPKYWQLNYKNYKFQVQLASSRHIGVFPEQATHWDWIAEKIQKAPKNPKVINLFGYTGLATIAAASAGAEVTHVDSSKHAITWANLNLKLSGLEEKPVRWIVEDALKFMQREARRGNKYDGIILDPPKFGRGSGGKVWDFYKNLPDLLVACKQVLSDTPLFIVMTSYAIQASALIAFQAVEMMTTNLSGKIQTGELISVEESGKHMLSHALFARWTSTP